MIEKEENIVVEKENNLFPVFLKLENLRLLIVGGGKVALEKLQVVLHNSPATKIKMVAIKFGETICHTAKHYANVELIQKVYEASDLDNIDIIIITVDNAANSEQIRNDAHEKRKLVNVADKPELCDFYLGSIVKKGNLKIAISTNGKSPTIAKRLKETFNDLLPDQLEEVLDNMEVIRSKMKGDFATKVNRLNKITKVLTTGNGVEGFAGEKRWRKIATYSVLAFSFMLLGHLVLSYISFNDLKNSFINITGNVDRDFYIMVIAGFVAQLIDGALGMGYGVICTSFLLSIGVNLPAISGSIHTAEIFSSAASGYSHYKFGNVNKKLFKVLLIPGVLGAILGAWLLSAFGNTYAQYMRPILACYTLLLGLRILLNAFKKNMTAKKVKRVGWLAGAGGFLDSFGGGGWGPLVTSTLISKGRTPKYVIGTVSITEFFVTLASALTFFTLIGVSHWQVIAGLVIGAVAAAPIAVRLAGRLPVKTMFVAVGVLVITWSIRILLKSLEVF